jgi:phosphatidylinositol alpha-mannosyltransferase
MDAVGPFGRGYFAVTSSAQQKWCIITCEYPPLVGGVSDHTFLLARALADAGDTVDVWAPPGASPPPDQPGVTVHLLPSLFNFDALRVLRRVLREQSPDTRVLVQYVPTGYGWRMMNLPFAFLLYTQRRRGLDIYFHEVGFLISRRERLRRNIAGVVHLVMNWFAVRAATRIFVAIPEWQRRLQQLGVNSNGEKQSVTWVPVPSNVPDSVDPAYTQAIRASLLTKGSTTIVGHFGTFGRFHTAVLVPAFARILDAGADRIALLVGRNSASMRDAFVALRPDLATRIVATGGLEPAEVSARLSACDVLLQPYDDGVSARRGSLMAGLALGRPVVSNRGPVTGDVWSTQRAVYLTDSPDPDALAGAVSDLLHDAMLRGELGASAKALHRELFALPHGVTLIRNAVNPARPLARGVVLSSPRVLMFHTTLPSPGRKPGGVEVAVHRLANALHDQGIQVTVASLTDAPTDARYPHRHLFWWLPWLRESRLGRLAVLPALLNLIRLNDAEVVHYHGDDWFVLRRPRATVRTLHGSALREAQQATRWQRRIVQYLVYPLERISSQLATITVAVGDDAASLHGISRVIGNGVDPELFMPGPKRSIPLILYVGTWEGRKRGRWMYELFTDVIAPRHPDAELRFIADEAPPPHPRVHYERFPDDAALAQAYREAWVFALPSTYEGFGIPYLEAMASGTAVLATPNTGARELLGNGRYGVLVADDEFGDTLLHLLRDSDARVRIAAAGLARSRDYAWPDVARAYVHVYDEAIQRQRDTVGDS